MTVAVDDMLRAVLQRLQRDDLLDDTIVVFGSDHGSLMGAHGLQPWQKRTPWEESVSVPLVVRLPQGRRGGSTCDALVAPVDLFPTLCGLCRIDPPRTVSGRNQADIWLGRAAEGERQALFTYCIDDALLTETTGSEWKGVRTRRWNYWRCLDGSTALYDIRADPLQLRNLSASEDHRPVVARMGSHPGTIHARVERPHEAGYRVSELVRRAAHRAQHVRAVGRSLAGARLVHCCSEAGLRPE